MAQQVVLDTSVLVAALRSRRGASHRLLMLVGAASFEIHLSVPLVLEYEDAAKRHAAHASLTNQDVDDIIDYLCRVGHHHEINFLWRPFLADPDDDHVVELAFEAGCEMIVTHNLRDFAGCERLGIQAITPGDFLRSLGDTS